MVVKNNNNGYLNIFAKRKPEVINKLSERVMPFFTIILEGHRKMYCWRREGQVCFDYRSQNSSGSPLNKKRTVPTLNHVMSYCQHGTYEAE